MIRAKQFIAAIALSLLLSSGAFAQNIFNTGVSGKTVVGVVMMCLNSSNIAVPTDQNGACPGGGSSGGSVNPATPALWGIGAADGSVPANVVLMGMSQSGALKALTGTAGNLNVQCANCSGSGVSTADGASFVAGSSLFAGGGGFYQTTATLNALTTGQQGLFQVTAQRALFSNLRNSSGAEIGTSSSPLSVSFPSAQAVTLASTTITGSVAVTGTFFQATQPVSGTVTANLGTLNGAATAALQSTGNTALGTINTTLGTPFQAGGSIGNTAFGATQSGTWSTRTQDGSGNALTSATRGAQQALSVQIVDASGAQITSFGSGTVNPTTAASWGLGATGASVPANAVLAGMSQGGNLIALTGTSGNLNVQCANCSGSGVSTADGATFTAGSSLFAGSGGFYQTTATSNPVTTGQQGVFQMTAQRALFTNLRNASGTEIGTSTTPLQVSLANTGVNGTALLVTGTGGTFPATQSGTWNITNISGTISLPTGAATAAKQPALGTAGTASTDVLTVQGIASMTPLLTNPGTAANWGVGTSTQNSSTVANGHLALGQFNTTPTTITSGNMSPLQMDNAGNLLVNVKAGTNSNGVQPMTGSSPVVIASDQVAVAVKNNGAQYETVAASQTAQAMGPTGATGDYLSHCVIYPSSTSPGVVTVFDNTNAAGTNAIAFAGGSTSTSNLTPIAVPVGAVSTAGAWKVTTGANVSVTCYGKFT